MPALSTLCRAAAVGPAAFVLRARALGATGLAFDASVNVEELAALATETLKAGLLIEALEAPCPRPPVPRPPQLATGDREERLAAARATSETVHRARDLGARVVVVELGTLPGHDPAPLLRGFARRELEPETIARLIKTRRALTLQALDWARFGLEMILDDAGVTGVTIGLCNRARWYEIPSAGEAQALLDEFHGAPLATFYDTAAGHTRRVLGFGDGRPPIEIGRAAGAWLTDAAGVRGGLPWGTGDVDAAVLTELPAAATRALHCLPLASDEELAAGLATR